MDARKSSIPRYSSSAAKSRPILELSTKEKIHFLACFDYVISGFEGVIWRYTEPIPNVGPGVMLVKQAGKQFKFLTNDSQHTEEEFEERLTSVGITDIKYKDIVYPTKSLARHVKKANTQNLPVFSICNGKANDYFAKEGINILTLESVLRDANIAPQLVTYENLQKIITPLNNKVCTVLMDVNYNLTYAQLAAAQQYLFRPECTLIAGSCDTFVDLGEGFSTIGMAGVIQMLENDLNMNKEPIILGQPSALLGVQLMDQFRINDTKRVLFVGCSLLTDIQFGLKCGFQTLFVLTGSSTAAEINDLPSDQKPDYIASSMADFVKFFEDLHANE